MKRRRSGGYTAVEVLVAMTLFAIGAAGVIGMMKVTIQGGQDARRMDIASHIAHTWIDRLHRDATYWNLPNRDNPGIHNLDQTRWLHQVGSAACNPPNWCFPAFSPADATQAQGSGYAFDYLGRDRWTGSGDHEYCVQLRFEWIYPLGNPPALNQDAVMRAEVRVFYTRLDASPVGDCASLAVSPDGPTAAQTYHFVHATTAIRETVR